MRVGNVEGGAALSARALVAQLANDPNALAALTQLVEHQLASGGLGQSIEAAAERVAAQARTTAPGRLLAGTVSTAPGAIQAAAGSVPARAMVFLGGSATAVAATIPSH